MTTKSLEVLLELKKGWRRSQHIKNNKETRNQEIMLQNINQDSAICISMIPLWKTIFKTGYWAQGLACDIVLAILWASLWYSTGNPMDWPVM